jgi:hypothetical protein
MASPAAAESPEGGSNSPAAAASGQVLGSSQTQYGAAPTRTSDVTYQPDVIIPDGGASAVRSVSSDGLTWTIDANAPHASELAVGKILFVTNRGVGRVLAATRTGDDLALTLGPVEITDVIQEAHLSGENVTVDPDSMTSYSAPDYPGTSVDSDKLAMVTPRVVFADGAEASQAPFELAGLQGLAGNGPPPSTDIGGYAFTAFCCGGLGVKIAHNDPSDVEVVASAVLRLGAPHVNYKLDISGGKIQTAIVTLSGTTGLTMQFSAGTAVGASGNVSKQFFVPVDLSFPIGGVAGVPLALTVHQQFLFKTAFTAKNSTLSATGDFGFSGALDAGYQNGSWGLTAPENYTANNSPVDAITGVSLGASAVLIAYEGRVIVGIGAFGFVTGPYVGFDATYGVTRGSDTVTAMGLPTCVSARLKTDAVAGVGYSMPQSVTKAINKILSALNAKPIQGFGGLKTSKEIKTFRTSRPSGCAG